MSLEHHELFNDKSALYERSRPCYPKELFRYLSQVSPSTNSAWDSACGNGQAAIGLAGEFDNVYATDVSVEQIANAKPHAKIHYSVAVSERPPFDNDTFDLVCVAQALHWFDHQAYWAEVHRVLKPCGVFAAWGYNLPKVSTEIDQLIKTHVLDVVAPYWAPHNKLLWNDYRDIHFPFEKLISPEFKLSVYWDLNELFTFIHSFSATRRCMSDIGDSFFDKALSNTKPVWGQPHLKRYVEFDFIFYAGAKK